MNMKAKTLLPIVAVCAGASFWGSTVLADEIRTDKQTTVTVQNPWMLSEVMDATVKDAQGDKLGQIKDVVFDPASGRPNFAVIKLSGDVGPLGYFAPVPLSLLKPETFKRSGEPKTFVLNVNRDQFASSQKFYLKHWPDQNEATWGPEVYSYYGLTPSGAAMGAPSTIMPVDTGTEHYYYRQGMKQYGPTRTDGTPIDNGTAPDGKGTFYKGPRF